MIVSQGEIGYNKNSRQKELVYENNKFIRPTKYPS